LFACIHVYVVTIAIIIAIMIAILIVIIVVIIIAIIIAILIVIIIVIIIAIIIASTKWFFLVWFVTGDLPCVSLTRSQDDLFRATLH